MGKWWITRWGAHERFTCFTLNLFTYPRFIASHDGVFHAHAVLSKGWCLTCKFSGLIPSRMFHGRNVPYKEKNLPKKEEMTTEKYICFLQDRSVTFPTHTPVDPQDCREGSDQRHPWLFWRSYWPFGRANESPSLALWTTFASQNLVAVEFPHCYLLSFASRHWKQHVASKNDHGMAQHHYNRVLEEQRPKSQRKLS